MREVALSVRLSHFYRKKENFKDHIHIDCSEKLLQKPTKTLPQAYQKSTTRRIEHFDGKIKKTLKTVKK